MIVADIDYDPTTYGLIGENATPVLRNQVTDVDYIRKFSDFVARVVAVNADVLTLSGVLVGGGSGSPVGLLVPPAAAKVQRVQGWTQRKGGAAVHHWSGVFSLDTKDGTQLIEYYPHLAISAFAGTATYAIESIGTTDLTGYELSTTQEALAFDDPIDGQTVVGYRAYYPAPGKGTVQI